MSLGWSGDDLRMTTGGFGAITVAMKVARRPRRRGRLLPARRGSSTRPSPSRPGSCPSRCPRAQPAFDLDLDAIAAAITPRTRIVVVNTPNNPTGRIYPPDLLRRLAALLDEASARLGRRIWIVSDEPYNRIVFDGVDLPQPGRVLPATP